MSERDILISRIVDREDTPVDWARLDELAAEDRQLKDHLLSAFSDESTLRAAVGDVIDTADRVELLGVPRIGGVGRVRNMFHWGGWMAAAVLAIIWMATDPRMKRTPEGSGPRVVDRQLSPRESGDSKPDLEGAERDAVDARLAGGEIVRELPNALVETRNIPGSDKIEVVYLRRILQRAVVSDAFTLGRDDTGQPVQVRFDPSKYGQRRRY